MKKKVLFTLLIFAMSISLFGCGKEAASSEPSAEPEEVVEEAEEEEVTEDADTSEEDASVEDSEIGAWEYHNVEEIDGEEIEWIEYLVFNEDGTGYWITQDGTIFTYGNGLIDDGTGDLAEYELNGDELTVRRYRFENTYNRLEGQWPENLASAVAAVQDNANYEEYSEGFIPDDFLQEREGVGEFASYDEIISKLEAGEAYSYVKFMGYDEEFLAITEDAYDDNGVIVSTSACIYGESNGVVKNIGNVFGKEGYPIKSDEWMMYTASETVCEADCLDKDDPGIMVMEYVYKDVDENGKEIYGGFKRSINSVMEDDGESINSDDGESFADLMEFYFIQNPVEFTVK